MNPYNPDYDFKQGNWRLIDDKAYPVQMGLAIDEMLFNKVDSQDYAGPNIIRFYQFSPPSVVLGNHQDIAELDLEYIKYRSLQVGRRITGGGTIIMGVPDIADNPFARDTPGMHKKTITVNCYIHNQNTQDIP